MTCDIRFESAPGTSSQGVFITFEGGEGVGKSTHIRILREALVASGREVVCLREPGGTRIGEQLRSVVLDPRNAEMADVCELFVYEAARAQLVRERIAPALADGAVVLCDRFCDSTLAYQAYGRGLDIASVRRANELACQGVRPDLTIVLEVPSAASGLERAAATAAPDRLEQAGEAFHERVREAFRAIADADPARVRRVVSSDSIEQTARSVFAHVQSLLPCLSLETLLGCARAAQQACIQEARS